MPHFGDDLMAYMTQSTKKIEWSVVSKAADRSSRQRANLLSATSSINNVDPTNSVIALKNNV